jgi:CheY-like chemotaxis protein
VLQEAAIDALLTKPVGFSDLHDTLAAMLGVRRTALGSAAITDADTLDLPTAASWRVLVAEDNPINQKVAAHQLAKLGIHPDFVGDGLAALTAVRQSRYDIVFMDCQMPLLDGYAATGEIRSSIAANDQPWIVAMTAMAMASDRERCLRAGMDDYIAKPFSAADLQAALSRFERRNKVSRAVAA